MQTLLFKNILF